MLLFWRERFGSSRSKNIRCERCVASARRLNIIIYIFQPTMTASAYQLRILLYPIHHALILLLVLSPLNVPVASSSKSASHNQQPICVSSDECTAFFEKDAVFLHNNEEEEKQNILEETPFSPVALEAFQLRFNDNISLSLLQARTAFDTSGADDTGLVLWGPSVTLGQYLANYHPEIIQQQIVMELGSGIAVPSLVACHLGASQVITTDFRQATLDHVQYHADQNKCQLWVQSIDWQNKDTIPSLQPDVILAADVIYGVALVPPLVKTIEKYLAKNGTLVIATRDGRHGIPEFRHLMKDNFVEITSESRDHTYLPQMPKQLKDDVITRGRWMGNHSIYTYKWRIPNTSE